MALTLSGTNGVVGAGFTVDASGVSVTAGVGTFSSIGAGASVPAAGLTGALPTISAANCTNLPAANLTGTLPAISGANLTGITAGITEVDMWRISTSANSNNSTTIMTSNWERSNATGFSKLGTGMSQSSGIFTFPSTGIYRLEFNSLATVAQGTSSSVAFIYIQATTDNSSYTDIIGQASSIGDSGGGGTLYYANFNVHTHLDVTDTSNIKVRFVLYSDGNVTWRGYTGYPSTYAIFTKIGET